MAEPSRESAPRIERIDPDRQARNALLRVMRVILVALFFAITLLSLVNIGANPNELGATGDVSLVSGWPWVLAVAVLVGGAVVLLDVASPKKGASAIFAVVLGLLAGLAATAIFGLLIDLVAEIYNLRELRFLSTVKVLLGVALTYLSISIVLQTQDDFRLVIPYVEFSKQLRGARPLLLDTSVLIDARFLDIGETGIVQAPVLIPRFVIDELQALADSGDRLKRDRGRRGLDVVVKLQHAPRLDVTIEETTVHAKAVDTALVELAIHLRAAVVTSDHALTRVAGIHGVEVINLNQLASAMRPSITPGDPLRIRLIKPGEQPAQAVGYLPDGAMVVADGASHLIGREADLVATGTLQTSAGRLIFARPAEDAPSPHVPEPSADTPRDDDPEDQPDAAPEPQPPAGPAPASPPQRSRARSAARNPRRG